MDALLVIWTVVGFAAMCMDLRMIDGESFRLWDMFQFTGVYAVVTATVLIVVSI